MSTVSSRECASSRGANGGRRRGRFGSFRSVVRARRPHLASQDGVAHLLRVPSKLLPQGHRDGVHEVRASDLDDGRPRLGFRVEIVAQESQRRDEALLDLVRRGDGHGGREDVVAGLGHVAVVVRVHGGLAPDPPAEHLDRAVGDDLVDVHVRLRAAAGLPHDQREVVVELALDDLPRRRANGLGDVRGKFSEALVHGRRGVLDDGERAEHLWLHAKFHLIYNSLF